jgi:hypothetical protein
MRTVLIGSDFMYASDGSLIPIEINTNIGWDNDVQRVEDADDVFDLTDLVEFITTNGFTKVEYIGAVQPFYQTLSQSVDIECNFHLVGDSLTVPNLEDNDTTLIIRSAYDTTALVDESYCANKVNFLNLISSTTFGSEFAYKDGTELVNTITTIPDNGVHPNFLLKAVIPHYDKEVYPKLFRVSNMAELETILNEVNVDYFLMPYHYNPDKLYQNHIQVVRSFNLLFPPDLDSISIGAYHKICINEVDSTPTYNPNTFLYEGDRIRYLTSVQNKWEPKLEDSDFVEMADGSFKTALDLQIGDEIRTIDIPNPFDVDNRDELVNYKISYDTLTSESVYSTNRVTNKFRIHKKTSVNYLTFTDGTDWKDVGDSNYLVDRAGEIRFINTGQFKEGDILILVDTTNDINISFVQKTIASKTTEIEFFEGWAISVERRHLFLTKTNENSNESFVAIEHNLYQGCGCYPNNYSTYYACYYCNGVCGKNEACYPSSFSSFGFFANGTCYGC